MIIIRGLSIVHGKKLPGSKTKSMRNGCAAAMRKTAPGGILSAGDAYCSGRPCLNLTAEH